MTIAVEVRAGRSRCAERVTSWCMEVGLKAPLARKWCQPLTDVAAAKLSAEERWLLLLAEDTVESPRHPGEFTRQTFCSIRIILLER